VKTFPKNTYGLFHTQNNNWPLRYLSHPEVNVGLLMWWLTAGIFWKSFYTGMGCAEMAMIALQWGLSAGHNFQPPPGSPGFVFQSACDINRSCRQVLLGWEGEIMPGNIHGDLLDRLPPHIRARYRAVPWPSKAEIENGPPSKISAWVDLSMEACEQLLDDPSTFDDASLSFCYNTGDDVSIEPYPEVVEGETPQNVFKGLRVAIGGLTCIDYTSAGDQLGMAGPSTKVMMVFVGERRSRKEPTFYVECVVSEGLEAYIRKRLEHIYDIDIVIVDVKEDLGEPHARKRMFINGVRRDMMVRTRPLADLKSVFKESLVGNGDMYFCMNEDKARVDIETMRKKARLYEEPGSQFAYHDVMPQYQQEHVRCFGERREELILAAKLQQTDAYIADVKDDAYDNHAKAAVHMTTTLRKSVHYSFLKGRCLLEPEVYGSMGIVTSALVEDRPS
jgi:site-specific DNA-cytosine methylase